MNRTSNRWLIITFLACFFAVGIPYWQVPYASASLPDTLYEFGLLVVVIASVFLRLSTDLSFWIVVLAIGVSVPDTVYARIAVETWIDPTSHNLWPFEIVIASAVGCACSMTGALTGELIIRFRQKNIFTR